MENNKNKKSVKFQGDMLNFCDFIQVFVFTTDHHLNEMDFRPAYIHVHTHLLCIRIQNVLEKSNQTHMHAPMQTRILMHTWAYI